MPLEDIFVEDIEVEDMRKIVQLVNVGGAHSREQFDQVLCICVS